MRDAYTSAAVGRVSLKRENTLCEVRAEICPEHRQSLKNYNVTISIDEDSDTITELKCLSCAASQGMPQIYFFFDCTVPVCFVLTLIHLCLFHRRLQTCTGFPNVDV